MEHILFKALLLLGGVLALGAIYTFIIIFINLISDDDGFRLIHLFRPYALLIEVTVVSVVAAGVHFMGKTIK